MPYSLEKGPTWSVVEAALSEDPVLTYWFLEYLRDDTRPIAAGPIVGSTTLDGGPTTEAERAEHLNTDWFGWKRDPAGDWVKPDPRDFDPVTNPSIGFWIGYWGDVEPLVRQTFVRAIEASLELRHDETIANPAVELGPNRTRRFWPITVFLKCPTPWFEGWVSWRHFSNARDDGEVIVHFHTPGHYGGQLIAQPANGRNMPPANPTKADVDNGMWVITHAHHVRHRPPPTTNASSPGQIRKPYLGLVVQDDGPMLVLSPTEADGGVRGEGRKYTPVTPARVAAKRKAPPKKKAQPKRTPAAKKAVLKTKAAPKPAPKKATAKKQAPAKKAPRRSR